MKKIFWTSIIFLLIVILFWAYARFFDVNLGNKVAPLFSKGLPVQTGTIKTGDVLFENLDALSTNLDIVANKVTEMKTQASQTPTSQVSPPVAPTEEAI